MSFDDDETSISESRPRTLIAIAYGTTTHYIACGQRDVLYAGAKYVAMPAARGTLVVSPSTAEVNMEIQLASNHAVVKRYLRMGSPPRQILVTVRRLQVRSGETRQEWVGYVTSLAVEGHTAKLLVPSRGSQSISRRLPTVLVDTVCQHILYDAGCKADRNANTYAAHVVFLDGAAVSVAFDVTYPAGDQWARGGELVHVASGERMTIWDQVATNLKMQAAIPEMKFGDAVQVVAGCDHSVNTCKVKFANVANFGGLPQRPTADPFLPTGFGVIQEA